MSASPSRSAPVTSLWLLAATPDEADFITEIETLARRHVSPVFHPHLTLLGDIPADPAALGAQARAIAAAAPAFVAEVQDIVTSDAYYRSFYAGFAIEPALARLRAAAIATFARDPGPFTPHVSLLYGPVDPEAKAASAAATRQAWNGRRVRFDRLAITNSGNDVPIPEWRCVKILPLTG